MKTTKELYGIEPEELSSMLYVDAIKYKIFKSKTLITELQEIHYMDRDDYRINELLKAVEFNKQLLS
ncbi:MAG: hypothetical protein U9Q40_08830, partial [Campylobacterota bacterium]|nr:hypothetical protein [Campylobacterota bacterium]